MHCWQRVYISNPGPFYDNYFRRHKMLVYPITEDENHLDHLVKTVSTSS